ncbi:MAG: efflux RND transporter permease subunit, partial [Bacteroidales bacterium]|nr:efflux RND transporter permease subunit [Bacteroidales bacterium]
GNSLFNANTMMGFLILLGVVVNNAIILIDFMNILRKRGFRKNRAIMVGGMSRVRPILITTITTCVAMLPLAMGQSEYVKAIGPPFAITVIGGLSVSTLLTLVFVPMLYNALEQALSWLGGLRLLTRIILIVVEVVSLVLLVYTIDQFMWQLAAIVLVIPGIPLSYWFISSSLRKAHEKIIPDGEALHIRISNLVKIYGRRGRVTREFAADRRMSERAGEAGGVGRPDFEALIWQLPLLLFLGWFTVFYLVSSFWQLVASVMLYGYLLLIINRFKKHYRKRWLGLLSGVVLYGAPVAVLLLFMGKWDNLTLTLFAGGLWYVVLAVGRTSALLRWDDFEIGSIRKAFRWFVRLIA